MFARKEVLKKMKPMELYNAIMNDEDNSDRKLVLANPDILKYFIDGIGGSDQNRRTLFNMEESAGMHRVPYPLVSEETRRSYSGYYLLEVCKKYEEFRQYLLNNTKSLDLGKEMLFDIGNCKPEAPYVTYGCYI